MANPIVQKVNEELEVLQKELGQFKSTIEYLNSAKTHVKEAVNTVNQAEVNFEKKIIELKNTYSAFIKLTDNVAAVITKIDTINFPERLDSIETTVKETISFLDETRKATLKELQKASETITEANFEGKFSNLESLINKSVQSSDSLTKYISKLKLAEKIEKLEKTVEEKLENSFTKIEKNTKKIADDTSKSIYDLNLPVKIDKLDANVSGIITSVQNVQSRLESVERNISDKLKDETEKQISSLSSFQENINHKFETLIQELKTSSKKQQTNTYITWALIIIATIAIITIK
jgi:prefoldin subunit 5